MVNNRMRQMKLFKENTVLEFGGSLIKRGKRKAARPLNFEVPIHLVLKAEDNVQLFRHADLIKQRIEKFCEKFDVKCYKFAVHEDHIHVLLKFEDRKSYNAWIRAFSGSMVKTMPDLKWRFLPWTRILTWGSQFHKIGNYIEYNRQEADFIENAWRVVEDFESSLAQFGIR